MTTALTFRSTVHPDATPGYTDVDLSGWAGAAVTETEAGARWDVLDDEGSLWSQGSATTAETATAEAFECIGQPVPLVSGLVISSVSGAVISSVS